MVLAFYETSAPRLYKLQVGGQYVIMIQKPTNDLHTHCTPHTTPDPHSAHAAAQSAGKHSSPGCSSPASQQRHQPTQEEIARRAYEYFLQRGQGAGQDKEDWFKAEQELLAKK